MIATFYFIFCNRNKKKKKEVEEEEERLVLYMILGFIYLQIYPNLIEIISSLSPIIPFYFFHSPSSVICPLLLLLLLPCIFNLEL